MPAAAIAAVATVGGAAISSSAQRRATSAQTQATNSANDLQRRQFEQSRADLAPWRSTGEAALTEIRRRLGLGAAPGTPGVGGVGGLTSGLTGQTQTGVGGAPIGSGGNLNQRRLNDLQQNEIAFSSATSPAPAPSPMTGQPVTGVLGEMGNNPSVLGNADQGVLASPMLGGKESGPQYIPGENTGGPQIFTGVGGTTPATPTVPNTPTPTMPGQVPGANDPENRYGGFYASPGYQFRMDEGNRAITGNRAASGMLQSGDTLRALTRYGQDYASNEFNTQLNQLFSAAGLGQTATSQGNVLGQNYASNVGANNINQGNVLASSYANQGNIWQNALGNLGGYAAYQWGGTANPSNSSRPAWTMGGF